MTFQKILCPTDFSEASYEGLRQAIELAADGTTEICVLHVEASNTMVPLAGYAPTARSEADHRAETVKNLCAVLEERVPQNVRTRPLLKQGEIAEEIVRAAKEEGADLIVLTTHGAGGLRPGELGSVATSVLQTAPCPVLTVNRSGKVPQLAPHNAAIFDSPTIRLEFEVVHATNHALYLDGD